MTIHDASQIVLMAAAVVAFGVVGGVLLDAAHRFGAWTAREKR